MDLPAGRWHDMIAGIGYGGRSVLMTGVGFFFFMAGVQHDSYEVEGP